MSKKKMYIQNSIFWQAICLLMLVGFMFSAFGFVVFIVGGIKLLCLGINDIPLQYWLIGEIVLSFTMVTCAFAFINMESYIIHLDNKRIWMYGEIKPKSIKMQYRTEVDLKDISEISLIYSSHDSKNRYMKGHATRGKVNRYLVFFKADGKQEWMNVSHYTDSYLSEILAEIIVRITNSPNVYKGGTWFDIISSSTNK